MKKDISFLFHIRLYGKLKSGMEVSCNTLVVKTLVLCMRLLHNYPKFGALLDNSNLKKI